MPGALTFPINKHHLAGGISVCDDDVCKAMAFAFDELKMIIEPGGAVALASVMRSDITEAHGLKGRSIALILSGGNADWDVYKNAIEKGRMFLKNS